MAAEPGDGGREQRVADNPGTATYGAIVVTSAITAAASHDDRPWAVLAKVGATLLVFWLAHVHGALIGDRFTNPDRRFGAALVRALHHELVMLEIGAGPIIILLAAALGLLRPSLAVDVAQWVGVAELFAIGILRGRRSRYSHARTALLGVTYALVGVGLVALKVAVH